MRYDQKILQGYLAEAKRISSHRTKGVEREIRHVFNNILLDVNKIVGAEYSRYENNRLTFDYLMARGRYAKFLEEVVTKVDGYTPTIKKKVTDTCKDIYSLNYNYMTKAVRSTTGRAELGYSNVSPQVLERAINNPISGLTLNDTLEKNRKDIIYSIKKEITLGLAHGDRNNDMALRVNRVLGGEQGAYYKAIRIVRTEAHRVQQEGQQSAAEDIFSLMADVLGAEDDGEPGLAMRKIWRTMKDERVRPNYVRRTAKGVKTGRTKDGADHTIMEGQVADVLEFFTLSDGTKTKAPGTSGVAGQDINCRCFVEWELV